MWDECAPGEKLLTKGEVAQLCRVEIRTVDRWVAAGKIVRYRGISSQRSPSTRSQPHLPASARTVARTTRPDTCYRILAPSRHSIANLVVVEAARKPGIRIGFLEFFRVGLPLTLVTVLLGWLLVSAGA